ncbi:MAG TPA: GTPase domain-containing protein [Smithellaceae bacterium]|nr:GTPase domain-containing protein [Candidatus Moranbacteria bacterium]HOG80988.1 GTPase domain-containing protein [Smithellaceae bacterium]HOQ40559.1 GTPase domain-containing protein [Smithellaceae bacterium]HPL65060.1 GTPase domain-containing protein [Smithellaceae bacterium]HRY34433.1 GTPase domain-containing protein [Smithellaceae bacterium]
MAFINLKDKVIQAKIVYYGPGRCGKTTNLEYIYDKCRLQINSEMVTVKTQGDRTLFFDFFPFDMGKISGYDVKIQLYTVPGQVKYNSTRRLVLKGVDGVVFVADSAADRRNKNIISIKNLEENLKLYNKNIRDIPLVIQYNKRDLAKEGIEILDVETLENDLNSELKVPSFEASAVEGDNVILTLKKIIYDTMSSLEKQLKQEP